MSEENTKQSSRRKFLKAGAIAGGAAVVGLSIGMSGLSKGAAAATTTPANNLLDSSNSNQDSNNRGDNDQGSFRFGNYKPQERWYFIYATDGISLVPTDKFGLAHRPVYMYGFATPMSWNKPYGWSKGNVGDKGVGAPGLSDLRSAFADLNWIDPTTQQPIMRGKAMNIGPPIWGVEGDILDITLCNAGFAFGSCVTDPHTIHLHGVHSPTYYDGIPEISFGVPMWNPYTLDSSGCPILPGHGNTSFTPATDANLTQGGAKGNVFTYRMFCERPGTYLYHCHVEASEHVHMGMYGPMWIYPKSYGNAKMGGAAYNNSLTEFSQEAVILLNDIDSRWHDNILDLSSLTTEPNPIDSILDNLPPSPPEIANFNIPDYRPNYWTINGRCLPDTLMAGKWNQGYQPGLLINGSVTSGNILNGTASQLTYYGSGITPTLASGAPNGWPNVPTNSVFFPPRQPVQTYIIASVTEKILIRLHNAGFQAQPMHFHGVMPNIVGKDTFAWVPQPNAMFSTTNDERKRMYTIGVFSGENYDLIAAYPDKAAISPSVYGLVLANQIKNNGISQMPYGTSETGQPPSPPFPLNTSPVASQLGGNSLADYGDIVHIADPSLPIILGPGALNPATGTPTPGTGVPGSSGPGFGADFATGYSGTGYPLMYLWHAHDDYKVTNDGNYPGGAVAVVKLLQQGKTSPTNSIPFYNIVRRWP